MKGYEKKMKRIKIIVNAVTRGKKIKTTTIANRFLIAQIIPMIIKGEKPINNPISKIMRVIDIIEKKIVKKRNAKICNGNFIINRR